MARDRDTTGVDDGKTGVGRTAVRARLFTRVDGMLLMADAAPPAPASLTASYEGTMTVLGTPGGTAVTAALAQAGGAVTGIVTLRLLQPDVAGVYVVEGRVHGRRFVVRGVNVLGARLRWDGELAADGAVHGPVRLTTADGRVAGLLTMAPSSVPGACGSESFAGEVVRQRGSDARTGAGIDRGTARAGSRTRKTVPVPIVDCTSIDPR